MPKRVVRSPRGSLPASIQQERSGVMPLCPRSGAIGLARPRCARLRTSRKGARTSAVRRSRRNQPRPRCSCLLLVHDLHDSLQVAPHPLVPTFDHDAGAASLLNANHPEVPIVTLTELDLHVHCEISSGWWQRIVGPDFVEMVHLLLSVGHVSERALGAAAPPLGT